MNIEVVDYRIFLISLAGIFYCIWGIFYYGYRGLRNKGQYKWYILDMVLIIFLLMDYIIVLSVSTNLFEQYKTLADINPLKDVLFYIAMFSGVGLMIEGGVLEKYIKSNEDMKKDIHISHNFSLWIIFLLLFHLGFFTFLVPLWQCLYFEFIE